MFKDDQPLLDFIVFLPLGVISNQSDQLADAK